MPKILSKARMPKPVTDAQEAEIIRRAVANGKKLRKRMEANKSIKVTRVYPDGRREKLDIPGHQILARDTLTPDPMSKEELKSIREKMEMTQEHFARWLMVSVGTVRTWEQKTGLSRGPALRLLQFHRVGLLS